MAIDAWLKKSLRAISLTQIQKLVELFITDRYLFGVRTEQIQGEGLPQMQDQTEWHRTVASQGDEMLSPRGGSDQDSTSGYQGTPFPDANHCMTGTGEMWVSYQN